LRIIKIGPLKSFWEDRFPDAENALKAWIADTEKATWQNSNELKTQYANADPVGNNRIVFNIRGNNYRLIVAISYRAQIVLIKFIGTHEEYDAIDVLNVEVKH
jgi:mRNA interferase HigB